MTTGGLSPEVSSCQAVVYSVLQTSPTPARQYGFTAALVAAHPGAGTTYLTAVLAQLLERDAAESVLPVDGRQLANLREDSETPSGETSLGDIASSELSWPPSFEGSWRGRPDYRAVFLAQLRQRFPFVLIDCPSLKESTDVLSLAPVVDGVLLVVEANRTLRSQVAYLERTIEGAGGKIYGHLLNRRTYPTPTWLHNKLERWGI